MLRLRYQVPLFCRRPYLSKYIARSEEPQRPYVRDWPTGARRGRAAAAARRD